MPQLNHDSVHTLSHAGSCQNPECCYVFPPIREAACLYFEHGHIICSQCHNQADLWDVVLRRMLSSPLMAVHLVSIGAMRTHFTYVIEAGKYHEIPLASVGIPEDATVLQVGYTPQGGEGGTVFPIEWHGNVPERRIGNVLRLFGQAVVEGDGTVGSACPVAIFVVWMNQEKEDDWPYVVNAFEGFVSRHYDRVIVPAQSAVEIALMPVARAMLEKHAAQDLVKQFTTDRLTFGDVLNIFLPFVCGQAGVSKMPDKIRGSLNKLRRKRNAVIHHGTVDANMTAQDAAEALCAAVFGAEYVRYVKPKLLAWLK